MEETIETNFILLAKPHYSYEPLFLEAVPAWVQMKLGRGSTGEDSQSPNDPSEEHNKTLYHKTSLCLSNLSLPIIKCIMRDQDGTT